MVEGVPATDLPRVWVGTAKAIITPPVGVELSGFVARTTPMLGFHDDLHARALVWSGTGTLEGAVALVTLEVIDLNADTGAAIRAWAAAQAGIPGERIGVACTHTHGGPATLAGRWLGRADADYLALLPRLAGGAIARAARYLEPATLTYARGREATVGENRRVFGGVLDPAVPTLRFQRDDGTVAALLLSYACHPVTPGLNNTLATANYPGYAMRALEAIYRGALVAFATGCCGQINAGHTARSPTTQPMAMGTIRRSLHPPLLPRAPDDELARLADAWQAERARCGDGKGPPGAIALFTVCWSGRTPSGPGDCRRRSRPRCRCSHSATRPWCRCRASYSSNSASRSRSAPVTIAYGNGTPGYIPPARPTPRADTRSPRRSATTTTLPPSRRRRARRWSRRRSPCSPTECPARRSPTTTMRRRTMSPAPPEAIASRHVDRLWVRVYADRAALGLAAGEEIAAALRARLARQPRVRMIFAAAPSQTELLAALGAAAGIDWDRVTAFHMDEYLDLAGDAPQRFGHFLREHLFARVHPGEIHYLAAGEISGDDEAAADAECARYAALLRSAPIDIVCLGIGENGHLAFNDPPVADFADPATVKPVDLDGTCRRQQVHDGCFTTLAAVPRRALTLTIPALTAGARLCCTVPGPSKRAAIRRTLTGPIGTACPASILRRHPDCTLYTDLDGYPASAAR